MANKSVKFNIMIKQGNTWYAPKIELANARPPYHEEKHTGLQQPNNSSSYPRTKSFSLLEKDKQRRCTDDSLDAPGHSQL